MICLLVLQISASIVNITAGIIEFRDSSSRQRGRLLLAAGLLGLGLIHYAVQRFDSGHALNSALISLSFLPLSIFVLSSAIAKAIPRWLTAAVALLLTIAVIHFLTPTFMRYFYRSLRVTLAIAPARQAVKTGEELEPGDKAIFITHNGRPFPFGFPYAADDADKLLTELERVSLPGQRLFVGPGDLRLTNYCDTYIYYMEPQLAPATYFLEMNPGSANAPNSRLPRDVANADWVILNRRWDFLNESNRSIQLGASDPNQIVRQNFDFWSESGSYLLFRNKKLRNANRPGKLILRLPKSTLKTQPPRLEHGLKNDFARHFRLSGAPIRERDWNLDDAKTFVLRAEHGLDLKSVALGRDPNLE